MLTLFLSCISMSQSYEQVSTQACDDLGLQLQVCAESTGSLGKTLERLPVPIQNQCILFPSRRAEIADCVANTYCNHFTPCLEGLVRSEWAPENDPDLCDAFRARKRHLLRMDMDAGERFLFHKAGAVCETDPSLAKACISAPSGGLAECIAKNSSLIPNDM
jgi:hypothetical protein